MEGENDEKRTTSASTSAILPYLRSHPRSSLRLTLRMEPPLNVPHSLPRRVRHAPLPPMHRSRSASLGGSPLRCGSGGGRESGEGIGAFIRCCDWRRERRRDRREGALSPSGDEALKRREPLDFVLFARSATEERPFRGDNLEGVVESFLAAPTTVGR